MFFEPIIEITTVLVAIVVWQHWRIKTLDNDLDTLYDRHNNFVEIMVDVLNGVDVAVEVDKGDKDD
jgi:hypothetical protein